MPYNILFADDSGRAVLSMKHILSLKQWDRGI
jgi:hypothetical protein